MDDTPEACQALVASVNLEDTAKAVRMVETLGALKGRHATRALAQLLLDAPEGAVVSHAADALARRKHKSCVDLVLEAYVTRPEILEDVLIVLEAIGDAGVAQRVAKDARKLMRSAGRVAAIDLFTTHLDKKTAATLLLELRFKDLFEPAADDLDFGLDQVLEGADDSTLHAIGAAARGISAAATAFITPRLPPESELEREAPRVARELLDTLTKNGLLEMVPGSEVALAEVIAKTMVDATSPKALVRDIERILESSPAVEEVFADRDDIKAVLVSLTTRR